MPNYRAAPDLLTGRVILLSGATGGIGRALALAAAACGAHMVLLGRNQKKLERLYDEIEAQGSTAAAILPFDLTATDPAAYTAIARSIEDEFGRLDGLVHAAADLGTLTPLELFDLGTWQRVLQVNLTAPFLLTRACLPLLKRAPQASIVFSSADVGRQGRAYWGAFGVAAFGIEGMAQILAEEVATNTAVRVYTLDPGAVRTTLRARAYPGENPQSVPAPEDIIDAYLYLLAPESRHHPGPALSARDL